MAKLETITNAGALMFTRIINSNTVFKFKGCKIYNNAVPRLLCMLLPKAVVSTESCTALGLLLM
jgi:hypothetical protein